MHSPRITLLSGDNPPSSSAKCLLHALSPQQPSCCEGEEEVEKKKKNRPSANQQAAGCSPKLRPRFYSVSRNGTLLVRSWGADWTIAWAIYLTSPLFVPFPFAPASSSMSNFILPIPKSFPSHRQRATNTFLRQPQQRNCRLSREVSLGDFRNAQLNRSPQNPITRKRKSLEASQKHNWRTQSPSWHPKLNLVSIKWFSQQLSIPE